MGGGNSERGTGVSPVAFVPHEDDNPLRAGKPSDTAALLRATLARTKLPEPSPEFRRRAWREFQKRLDESRPRKEG